MNSSNKAVNLTQPFHENEVNIPVVVEFIVASKSDKHIPNKPLASPVEVFTTTVSNVLEWSMEETLTKEGTRYYVGVDKRSPKVRGGIVRMWQ